MQKRVEFVIDLQGRPVAGATVQVNRYPGGGAATIYSDDGVTQRANPISTDSAGRYEYYAANGHYAEIITTSAGVQPAVSDILFDDSLTTNQQFAAATGTGNAMVVAAFQAGYTLADGEEIRVRAPGANTVSNPTISLPGVGVLTIYRAGGRALAPYDIAGAGHEIALRYRAAPARVELTSPADGDEFNAKKHFGAAGDNAIDDTTALQNAIDAANTAAIPVFLPAGTYLAGKLTIYSNTRIVGAGRDKTTIKLKNNANSDLIYGQNSDALWGTNTEAGISNWQLIGLTLDGNRANNSAGSCIAVYGHSPVLKDLFVKNAAEHGIRTDWYEFGEYPMEGYYENIRIDITGKHGWWNKGPHDSTFNNVVIVDASQSADNTYDGFREEGNGASHHYNVHVWNLSITANTPRYGIVAGAPGATWHICGSDTSKTANLLASGVRNRFHNFVSSGSRGGLQIHLRAGEIYFEGKLDPKLAGAAAVVGVKFGDGGDSVIGCMVIINCANQDGGFADFTNTAGQNYVLARGILDSGVTYVGTPHVTDTVDARFTGAAGFKFAIEPSASGVTAAGTVQGDATAIFRGVRTHHISVVAAGTGVRLWTPAAGEETLVFNAGANTLNIYPAVGGQIRLAGTNVAITVASGAGVLLRSVTTLQWVTAP